MTENPRIRAEVGDITKPNTEALISAANGVGVMGRGVAGAIARAAGNGIVAEARAIITAHKKPFEAGECYTTHSYNLSKRGVKRVYHAVTMQFPGGFTSIFFVNKAVRSALEEATLDGMKSITIPGLGTGVGKLDKTSVAKCLVAVAQSMCSGIEIKFLDKDEKFIEEVRKFL